MVCDDRTLAEVANEFLALKKVQKVRERTLNDYKKYIDKFLEQPQNSFDVDVLKMEILEYFADIPKTGPARFNHPYQYLHTLFAWAAKQDYIPYNLFEKLEGEAEGMGKVAVPHKRWEATASQCVGTELQEIL